MISIKKIHFIIIFILLILFINFCSRDNNTSLDDNHQIDDDTTKIITMPRASFDRLVNKFYQTQKIGYMFIVSSEEKHSYYDHRIQYNVIFKKTNTNIIISDKPIMPGDYYFGFIDARDSNYNNKPAFGKITNWSIEGYDKSVDSIGFEGFSTTMYVPEFIKLNTDTLGYWRKFSKSDGIDLKWKSDNLNQNGVWVIFQFDINDDVDGDNDFFWYKNIPDNGYYRLNTKRFDFIPTPGAVTIQLWRYNEKYIPIGKDTFAIRSQIVFETKNRITK